MWLSWDQGRDRPMVLHQSPQTLRNSPCRNLRGLRFWNGGWAADTGCGPQQASAPEVPALPSHLLSVWQVPPGLRCALPCG